MLQPDLAIFPAKVLVDIWLMCFAIKRASDTCTRLSLPGVSTHKTFVDNQLNQFCERSLLHDRPLQNNQIYQIVRTFHALSYRLRLIDQFHLNACLAWQYSSEAKYLGETG